MPIDDDFAKSVSDANEQLQKSLEGLSFITSRMQEYFSQYAPNAFVVSEPKFFASYLKRSCFKFKKYEYSISISGGDYPFRNAFTLTLYYKINPGKFYRDIYNIFKISLARIYSGCVEMYGYIDEQKNNSKNPNLVAINNKSSPCSSENDYSHFYIKFYNFSLDKAKYIGIGEEEIIKIFDKINEKKFDARQMNYSYDFEYQFYPNAGKVLRITKGRRKYTFVYSNVDGKIKIGQSVYKKEDLEKDILIIGGPYVKRKERDKAYSRFVRTPKYIPDIKLTKDLMLSKEEAKRQSQANHRKLGLHFIKEMAKK